MSFTAIAALAAGILFCCALIRSAVGFGDALLAMPLLGLVVDLNVATPLVGMAGLTISATILATNRSQIEFRAAWRLVAASLVGIPFGLALLHFAPPEIAKLVLGLLLISYGVYSLASWKLPELSSERFAYPFGFVAGALGAAYNTNGPPVVVYGSIRRWPPADFRATLQSFFFFSNISIVLSHSLAGLWTQTVVHLYGLSLPVILLAVWLGGAVNRRIPVEAFRRGICFLLIAVGVLFLVS